MAELEKNRRDNSGIHKMSTIISSRFFLRVLRYFCVFLLLACITMVSTYLITSKEIENQYRTKARSNLTTLTDTVDTLFTQVRNSGVTFFFDNVIESYFKPSERMTELIRAELWKIPQKLQQDEQTFTQLIQNSFAYFTGDETVYTSSGSYDSDFFFTYMNSYYSYSPSFWLSSLQQPGRRIVLPPSEMSTPGGTTSVIPVVTTYRLGASTGIHVSNVSMVKFASLFPQGSMEGSTHYLITDEMGNFLINTAESIQPSSLEAAMALAVQEQVEPEITLNGETYILFSHGSDLSGWNYFMLLPKADLARILNMNLYIVLGIGAAVLLLGLLLTFLFAANLSRPIRTLATSLTSASPADNDADSSSQRQDEMKVLQKGVTHLLSLNRQLTENEAHYTYEYIDHSLKMLMHGIIPENMDKLKQSLATLWKYDDDREFICPVLLCDFDESLYAAGNHDQMQSIVADIMATARRTMGDGPLLSIQDSVYTFILPLHEDTTVDTVKDLCRMLGQELSENARGYRISLGIGAPVRGIEHLAVSYNQALGALQGRDRQKEFNLIVFSELPAKEKVGFSFYNQKSLVYAVRNHDAEALGTTLDDILSRNHQRLISTADKQELYMQLIMVGQRCMEDYGLKLEDIPSYASIRQSLLSSSIQNTPHEASRSIHLLFTLIMEMTSQSGTPPTRLVEQVKTYIQENYSQPLSLEIIAEHFQVTPKYLSRLFKLHTGETLTTTLALIRIEKAKQLLQGTNLKVSDIGRMVGMDSRATFQRVFKKIEGVTAQEYRNSMENITLPTGRT